MSLLHELRDLAEQYLDSRISIDALEDALGDLAIPIAESGDSEAVALDGLLTRLLSEYGYSHRGEMSVRGELSRALPVRGERSN